MSVKGNIGNFYNIKRFHSFTPMEETDYKEKLLKGADELFMKYGLRSVSMDDIARHLGVSKKTIYQHFADKDEVVVSVAKSLMAKQKG